MSRGWVVLLLWGVMLGVLWVVHWAIFDPDLIAFILLGSASLATVLMALWALLAGRRRDAPADDDIEAVSDASHATVLLGLTILLLVLATELGAWLAFLSAGTGALAIGGLIRERMAERRAVRAAREEIPGA